MLNRNVSATPRRSSRVPAAVPILVTSLDPGKHFSEVCETLVVNAHGCAMRSPMQFKAGSPLHFHSKDGRQATAQVVSCQPIGPDGESWRLGARLDRPENFWGLRTFPQDWAATGATSVLEPLPRTLVRTTSQLPPNNGVTPANGSSQVVRVSGQSARAEVKRMIAESVRPLEAEIAALKEKLSRAEGNRSRFDVSLSSIPPELEQQLELRLRKELEPRVVEEARQQSTQLLAGAKTAIEQRTSEAREVFLRRLAEEFQVFERRAQELSAQVAENARGNLRGGLAEFQQKLAEGGDRLKQMSQELLESLESSLHQQHDERCQELEQVRAAVRSESGRLQEQVAYLDSRITALYESACRLESGVDKRLEQMATDSVSHARNELETLANATLQELTMRGTQAIGNHSREACENLRMVEREILASLSGSLKTQAAQALRAFEHSMEELAKHSVEGWRHTLARGLNAAVKSLGEQLQFEAEPGDGESESDARQ